MPILQMRRLKLREVRFLPSELVPANEVVSLGWRPVLASSRTLTHFSPAGWCQAQDSEDAWISWYLAQARKPEAPPGVRVGPGADAEWAQAAGVGTF